MRYAPDELLEAQLVLLLRQHRPRRCSKPIRHACCCAAPALAPALRIIRPCRCAFAASRRLTLGCRLSGRRGRQYGNRVQVAADGAC